MSNPFTGTLFLNSLEQFYDTTLKQKLDLMEELRKETDNKLFNNINQKMTIIDIILKNIIKYKTLLNKEKLLVIGARINKLGIR